MSIVEWINNYNGFMIFLLTFFLVVINALMLRHERLLRLSNERPDVVLYMHPSKNGDLSFMEFSIINDGNSSAFNIKIKLETSMEELNKFRISGIGYDQLCFIPILPKGETLTTFFASAYDFPKSSEIEQIDYTISYEAKNGVNYEDSFAIPIKYLFGMSRVGNNYMKEIAKNIKELSENVKKIQNSK